MYVHMCKKIVGESHSCPLHNERHGLNKVNSVTGGQGGTTTFYVLR